MHAISVLYDNERKSITKRIMTGIIIFCTSLNGEGSEAGFGGVSIGGENTTGVGTWPVGDVGAVGIGTRASKKVFSGSLGTLARRT